MIQDQEGKWWVEEEERRSRTMQRSGAEMRQSQYLVWEAMFYGV